MELHSKRRSTTRTTRTTRSYQDRNNEVSLLSDDNIKCANKEDKIKVIFHVHLPKGIENYGQPVVLGNMKELVSWEKLYQPYQNSTYWRSEPITILTSKLDIRYKYALMVRSTFG